jgi:hypothetical protein
MSVLRERVRNYILAITNEAGRTWDQIYNDRNSAINGGSTKRAALLEAQLELHSVSMRVLGITAPGTRLSERLRQVAELSLDLLSLGFLPFAMNDAATQARRARAFI